MKLSNLLLISAANAKVTSEKGSLSVSHRNTVDSKLPVTKPSSTDNVPDFIIMGVNKCGTTAASFFLSNHPELQKAQGEPNFFNMDANYKKGYKWYSNQFPKSQDGLKTYEKTPSYYKSIDAQKRVKAANKNIKLVNVVCDNVHRTLSRYLHIQKHAVQKLPELGDTLEEFNDNLQVAATDFSNFLEEVKNTEGFGTMDGLVEALLFRLKHEMRPFDIHTTTTFEKILSDGLYSVFHRRWLEYFHEDQLLVVNGNDFLNTPWVPMKKIQEFIGVAQNITRDSFIVPEDEEGNVGLPCFLESQDSKADCLGKGASEKGRSLDKRFSKEVTELLHGIFQPFDLYFAHRILHRQTFDWNFGME